MIPYTTTSAWGFFRWRGSVAPRALKWAAPCALLAVIYHKLLNTWTSWGSWLDEPSVHETTAWTLFTSILGFLIVFRAQLSYGRYWEGITLVEQACGVWLNGCSNLIAFCSQDPEKRDAVEKFQYTLSRLMSLMVCYSMCDISSLDRSRFPHLELEGLDPASMEYLDSVSARQNVALQWVQRLVVESSRSGAIDIAPPILSRVFQELSIGYVHFIDANKITTVPFPFEFAQMVWMMLVFFSTGPVPAMCAVGMTIYKSAGYAFVITFVFWAVHYIAVEIESPFGDDPNDLPLDEVNLRFNRILLGLLDKRAQNTPGVRDKVDISTRLMRSNNNIRSSLAVGMDRCDDSPSPRTSGASVSGAGTTHARISGVRTSGAQAGPDVRGCAGEGESVGASVFGGEALSEEGSPEVEVVNSSDWSQECPGLELTLGQDGTGADAEKADPQQGARRDSQPPDPPGQGALGEQGASHGLCAGPDPPQRRSRSSVASSHSSAGRRATPSPGPPGTAHERSSVTLGMYALDGAALPIRLPASAVHHDGPMPGPFRTEFV